MEKQGIIKEGITPREEGSKELDEHTMKRASAEAEKDCNIQSPPSGCRPDRCGCRPK